MHAGGAGNGTGGSTAAAGGGRQWSYSEAAFQGLFEGAQGGKCLPPVVRRRSSKNAGRRPCGLPGRFPGRGWGVIQCMPAFVGEECKEVAQGAEQGGGKGCMGSGRRGGGGLEGIPRRLSRGGCCPFRCLGCSSEPFAPSPCPPPLPPPSSSSSSSSFSFSSFSSAAAGWSPNPSA